MLVLTNLNFNGNQITNVLVDLLAADPASPARGRLWFNTTANVLRYHNGTSVVDLTASGVATDSNLLNGQSGAYYLSRANHTGTQTAATISDFAAQVQATRLDQFLAPTAAVNINGQRLTNVGAPSADTDAVNKAYVDAARTGLDVKASVRVATTATITLSGTQTIDGVALVAGDRVLVKNQTTATENGLYAVAAGAWVRTADADANSEVSPGMFTFVEEGTVNGDTGWVLTTNGAITLGTTALAFTKFSSAGDILVGVGLLKTGNTIAIDTASGYGMRKFGFDIGDGSALVYQITHNLNTEDVLMDLRQKAAPKEDVIGHTEVTSVNAITVRFAQAPAAAQYRLVVAG